MVLLPRLPLGLALLTTARTYEAVAAAVRAAAALAAAADAAPGTAGTALRCLVDGCLARLRQLIEAAEAAGERGSGGGRGAHKRSRQLPPERAAADLAGQAPWQLQAASLAAVLAELLLGASPAWQPSWRVGAAAAPGGGGELEALAAAVVRELVCEAVWSLPTSVAPDGWGAGGGGGGSTPLLLEASPGQQRLTAQQLGCNALLQRAALECCGTAARALGPRFAQNGRLLRTALLPLLEKLGEGWGGRQRGVVHLSRITPANPSHIQLHHPTCRGSWVTAAPALWTPAPPATPPCPSQPTARRW